MIDSWTHQHANLRFTQVPHGLHVLHNFMLWISDTCNVLHRLILGVRIEFLDTMNKWIMLGLRLDQPANQNTSTRTRLEYYPYFYSYLVIIHNNHLIQSSITCNNYFQIPIGNTNWNIFISYVNIENIEAQASLNLAASCASIF